MNADSERYFWMPRQFIDVHLSQPDVIGFYGVIVRSWIAAQGLHIALSDQDILTLCPDLNRGKLLRIRKRLITDGWIMTSSARGKKTEYTPCWKKDVPWQRTPGWGRPSGLRTVRVDPRIYDHYLGRSYPQSSGGIVVERYIEQPLTLQEIGTYILALRTPQAQSTPMLDQLELIANGEPQPLPEKDTFLQSLAQQNLLSPYGQRYHHQPLKPLSGSSFYLTQNMIAFLIFMLIGKLIDPIWTKEDEKQAPREDSERSTNESIESPWSPCSSWISCTCESPCHPKPKKGDLGGQEIDSSIDKKQIKSKEQEDKKEDTKQPARKRRAAEIDVSIMSSKGATLLNELGVSGKKIKALCNLDLALIEEVVKTARANMRLRNPAGWAVWALETVQREGIDVARKKCRIGGELLALFSNGAAAQDIKRVDQGNEEREEEGIEEGNIQNEDGPEKMGEEVGLVYDLPKLDHKPSAEPHLLEQDTTSNDIEEQEEVQKGSEEGQKEDRIEEQAPSRDITEAIQKYVHDRRHWIFAAIVNDLTITLRHSTIEVTVVSPETERTTLSHLQILKDIIEDAIDQPCWNIEIKRGYTVHDAPNPTAHQSQVVTAPAWIDEEQWYQCPSILKGILSQAYLNDDEDLIVPFEFQRRGLEQQRHELISLFGPTWATKQILCTPHERPRKPRHVWQHRS